MKGIVKISEHEFNTMKTSSAQQQLPDPRNKMTASFFKEFIESELPDIEQRFSEQQLKEMAQNLEKSNYEIDGDDDDLSDLSVLTAEHKTARSRG